jgi:DNA-directed RNA polymerase specialized sigma24 family protein
MSDVTRILSQIDSGDPQAAEQLLPLVYDELRKLAAAKLAHEKPGQTLQATALVHEAYLRLVGGPGVRNQESGGSEEKPATGNLNPDSCSLTPAFSSRGHFFAAAAEAMRRILVEAARRKGRVRHGGEFQRQDLDVLEPPDEMPTTDLLAVDEALTRLGAVDPLAASVVKLRYFTGLTMPEVATALDIPLRTAERNWTYAKTWLHRELG